MTADTNTLTVLANKKNFASARWTQQPPPFKRQFRSSLAYRLCLVAEGRFDAMLTLYPTWEWDIAAGVLICHRARVDATESSGAELHFNNPDPRVDGTIAAPSGLHRSIRAMLTGPRA
jgi:myo-inositol-1(or 4)-monophosphatase